MGIKDFLIKIKDRSGEWEAIEANRALEVEAELNRAKALLREMALLLVPPPGSNILEIMKTYIEDVKTLDFIEEYGLYVCHTSAKAKVSKGQEWAVQDEHFSELFERSTLEEAVRVCVKKLQDKAPVIYVDDLLRK